MVSIITLEQASKGLLDFHIHSTHSDGTRTPAEVVEDAQKVGISAIALTDHNIISGLEEFTSVCKEKGIFYIPFGTEIYAELPQRVLTPADNEAPDLIILGRNAKTEPMYDYQELLLRDTRERILPHCIKGLESVGFEIPKEILARQYKELETELQAPPQILHDFIKFGDNLEILVEYVSSVDQKVSREEIEKRTLKYINKHLFAVSCPAYTKRINGFNVDDAISLTKAMNCKLFIAHPGGEFGSLSDAMLSHFIETGIKGIEVRSYFNTPEQNVKFDRLAREYSLTRSGGSDYHGPTGAFKLGIYDRPQNQLPKDILEELWESLPN